MIKLQHDTEIYYREVWREMFRTFLGWSDGQFQQWLDESNFGAWISNPNDLLFHEAPQYWGIGIIITNIFGKQLDSLQRIQLEHRLYKIFDNLDFNESLQHIKWPTYRDKINVVLQEYNMALPPIAQGA